MATFDFKKLLCEPIAAKNLDLPSLQDLAIQTIEFDKFVQFVQGAEENKINMVIPQEVLVKMVTSMGNLMSAMLISLVYQMNERGLNLVVDIPENLDLPVKFEIIKRGGNPCLN